MLTLSQLKTALTALEGKTSTQVGNNTEQGLWRKIALAMEAGAGFSSSANDTIPGYMLRTAKAAESKWGGSGAEENTNEAGLLKRIVDAMEISAGVGTGSWGNRFATRASLVTFGITISITSANPSDAYDQSSTVGGTLTSDAVVTWSKSGADAAKLTLNAATGVWSLDTSAVGTLDITVTANDGLGHTASQAWSFTIVAVASLPAPVLTWVSDTTTYDPVFSLTEITESDVAQLQVDDNSDFSSTYGDATNTIDAAEALSGSITFAIPTLALATTYYARARYQRGGIWSGWSTSVSKAMAADTTAPTLSSPTDTSNGSTGATISVSTNEGNGTLYWFISTSSTPPSAANLKTGTGSVAFGSQAVSGTGVQNASPTGLTASTAYYAHFLHRDAAGNDSTIASADGFTTAAPAGLPATGMILRLDADDTSKLWNTITATTAITDGAAVGTWQDGSGNGFDLTAAANDTTRPTYNANGGLPYVLGDGSNDVLRRAAALGLKGNAYTVAIAMRTTGTPGSNNLSPFAEGRSSSNNPVYAPFASVGAVTNVVGFLRDDAGASYAYVGNIDGDAFDGSDTVLLLTHDGAGNLICYEDGDTTGVSKSYTPSTTTVDRFGLFGWWRAAGASFLGMRLYSFAAWNRVLNSTERAQVRTYMGSKQGRTL